MEQTTGLAPVQVPAWQVSSWVQALPSVQVAPSGLEGLEQMPVPGSQVPGSWHGSGVEQTTGLAPVQVPAWQVSSWVQALPSLQAVPLVTGEWRQPEVPPHTSVVHGLESTQRESPPSSMRLLQLL